MSLSAQNRKIVWEEHKDSLRRLQSRVSGGGTPPNRYSPPRRTPPNTSRYSPQRYERSPHEGRRSHSPYGKYRKPTSPAYLHRIETPPDHDRLRNKNNLRQNKYGVVPPVHTRSHQTPDYDSWGEESDEDTGDENYVMPQHYPYGYPAYGYPAYHPPQSGQPPPQVVFGAPFPIYYPPPPQYGYKSKKARDKRAKKGHDRLNVHQSQPQAGRASKFQKSPKVHHSVPTYQNYMQNNRNKHERRREEIFDTDKNDVLKRYKYIEPQATPYTPENIDDIMAERYKDEPDLLALQYYNDHPLFSEDFVNWFINDSLEEIIPDLLIETINNSNKLPRDHPYYDKAKIISNQIFEEVLPDLTHEVVRLAMNELVGDYMGFSQKPSYGSKELVGGAAPLTNGEVDVSDTVTSVFQDLLDDHIEETQQELLDEIITDAVIEQIVEEDIIVEEVNEEAPDVAQEVLSQYDLKIERRELKEVAKQAGDKLQESILLDYILSMIASQGRVWSESDHANKYLDDLLLDLLIEEFYLVKEHREKTTSNNPLRRLHEKVSTEVAVDLLLQQLTSSLDEDLADVDEYERGVDDVQNTIKTPIIPRSIQKYSR